MATTTEKLKEVIRELKMRKDVYPRWVLQGRIRQEVADKRIKIMEEIVEDYKQKLISEDKQAVLFVE